MWSQSCNGEKKLPAHHECIAAEVGNCSTETSQHPNDSRPGGFENFILFFCLLKKQGFVFTSP